MSRYRLMWLLKIVSSHFNFELLRYFLPRKDRPALKIINLAKETRNSGALAMEPHRALLGSYPT